MSNNSLIIKNFKEKTGIDLSKEKEYKNTLLQISKTEKFIKRMHQRMKLDYTFSCPLYFFNTLISVPVGGSEFFIAEGITQVLFDFELISIKDFIEIDYIELSQYLGRPDSFINDYNQYRVVFVKNLHKIYDGYNNINTSDAFVHLNHLLEQTRKHFVYVLSTQRSSIKADFKAKNLDRHVKFMIDIPEFNYNSLFESAKLMSKKEGYKMHISCKKSLINRLNMEKSIGTFENLTTVREIIESAIISSQDNPYSEDPLLIMPKHLTLEEESSFKDDKKSVNERLNNLVGLEKVKQKVIDITNYLRVQQLRKKNNFVSRKMPLHMVFTGNPGTGKTTVARIMGQFLKDIGILETGVFVEASRKDLIGQFIGQTSQKTSKMIKKAMGGVLFIDEAYSLNSPTEKDYGPEAISTLIKEMEDNYEKFVVIFAGYPKEMDDFLSMNPGLKDRVQFKIDFPDYQENELVDIFKCFCIENEYNIDEDIVTAIKELFFDFVKVKDSSFSNARLVRKCFDRAIINHANRIIKDGKAELSELSSLEIEDIKSLKSDPYVLEMLEGSNKNKIGFM